MRFRLTVRSTHTMTGKELDEINNYPEHKNT